MPKSKKFKGPEVSRIKVTKSLEFEVFAVTLLLCTPSDLHNMWLDPNKDISDWKQHLILLGLSDDAIKLGLAIMSDGHLRPHRHFFGAIASSLKEYGLTYDVGGPHPMLREAQKIVAALQSK
jgi:hypothetical protein